MKHLLTWMLCKCTQKTQSPTSSKNFNVLSRAWLISVLEHLLRIHPIQLTFSSKNVYKLCQKDLIYDKFCFSANKLCAITPQKHLCLSLWVKWKLIFVNMRRLFEIDEDKTTVIEITGPIYLHLLMLQRDHMTLDSIENLTTHSPSQSLTIRKESVSSYGFWKAVNVQEWISRFPMSLKRKLGMPFG